MGIVQSIIADGSSHRITVAAPISSQLHIDQSVSHDGVCLTVISTKNDTHQVQVVSETLSKTTFAAMVPGQTLNLETSISPSTLLDGHLVQGHIDTTLECMAIDDLTGSWKMKFQLPKEYAALVIPQGSICLNGVSLTIAHLDFESFEVAIIPYTYHHTNFKFLQPGHQVNVEFDLIGKYLLRQLQIQKTQ